MSRLLIIGGGGHGAVVAEAAFESDRWSEIAFLDDSTSNHKVLDFPVIGSLSELASNLDGRTESIVAMGDNHRRLELLELIVQSGGAIATVVHPTACVSRSATILAGVSICAGAIINARARIGLGCIINTGATVDHDCEIGDGAHISPGANLAGGVAVSNCAWIGIGASVKEGIRVGRNAIVGVGSAVVSNIEDDLTVGGVPARKLRTE